MDQSIPLAHAALANPPPSIKDFPLMQQAQANLSTATTTPDDDGRVSSVTQPDSSSPTRLNGSRSTLDDEQRSKLQVVDEDQKFTTTLNDHLSSWHLLDAGFNYNVVAVFGSQSTGKSTLLNRLFGTRFDVMNETERRQTTKGIWMSKGKDMPVLVMDVEGTDGRERGEDQDFERKSALFSMAVSEVLLVNIWEHQVGLYQGANMGLLKTVFEVNLGLFLAAKDKGKSEGSSRDKTLLLFVIRDHIGATPLSNLRNTLTADLNRLWDSLSKPEGLEASTISHFFDLEFVTLPHKLLQPEQFEESVVELRKKFVKGTGGNVFKDEYHKRIPADGINQYMSSIWEAVVSNKDLDLPTQQELLAQFRCAEIASTAFAAFQAAVREFPSANATGHVVDNLGSLMAGAIQVALASYDTAASRYHPGVYSRQRVELVSKLHSTLHPLFLSQLKNVHKRALRQYRVSIEHSLKQDGYDFAQVVQKARAKAEAEFDDEARKVELRETESGWSSTEQRALLEEDLESVAELLRKEETRKMVAIIERNIKKQVADVVEVSLTAPTPDMWDKVLSNFKTSLDKAEQAYLKKATSFNCTDEENTSALSLLRRRAWLALRSKIDEHASESALLTKLKGVFEDKFRYDSDGVPRVWKPEDDIDGIFKKAREGVLELIPLYATIKPVDPANEFVLPESSLAADSTPTASTDLEPFEFDSSLEVLTASQQASLVNRFKRESDAYYLEAKRSMVSSSSQIPVWIYGVLVVLGWNEFVAVIRSPVYFTFLLLAGAAAYVTWSLNMTGPVLAVTKGVTNEIIRTVNEQLHNYFSAQTPDAHARRAHSTPIAVPASSNSTTSVEEHELREKKKEE
ncbi:hypothetical protein JCM10212_003030 [Sporobolomyces blumeae]